MISYSEIKNQEHNGIKCIYFAFGVDRDYDADLLSLKLIGELIDSGYNVVGYSDDCHYWSHEEKWGREIFIRGGV